MNRDDASSNPYAPPATESADAETLDHEDPKIGALIKILPSRRGRFASVLSIGGIAFTLGGLWAMGGAWASAAEPFASPRFAIATATLSLGVPFATLGGLLALRVRLVQFIAFPMTCVCGGIGAIALAIALVRANMLWAPDDLERTLVLLTPIVAYLAAAGATGYVFHRTIMALANAGVPFGGTRQA